MPFGGSLREDARAEKSPSTSKLPSHQGITEIGGAIFLDYFTFVSGTLENSANQRISRYHQLPCRSSALHQNHIFAFVQHDGATIANAVALGATPGDVIQRPSNPFRLSPQTIGADAIAEPDVLFLTLHALSAYRIPSGIWCLLMGRQVGFAGCGLQKRSPRLTSVWTPDCRETA